jgi:type 1 glutamine amidotransferase
VTLDDSNLIMDSYRRRLLILLTSLATSTTTFSGALPHVEQLAPDVFAAGFGDRYGSANCGWVALSDQTLLIDLPHGIAMPDFLAEVTKTTGKPVRSFILTHAQDSDTELIADLIQQGLRHLSSPTERSSIGDAAAPIEFIPYRQATDQSGAAIFLSKAQVLFAGAASVNGPRVKLHGSDTASWISTLAGLEKLPAQRVVPGFGSWGSPAILERQRLFLVELRRQIAYKITMGIHAELIEKGIVIPSSFSVWMPYDTPTTEDIRSVYDELTVPAAPYQERSPQKSDPQPHALVLIGDRFHEPEHIESGLRPVFDTTGVIPHFLFDVRGLTAENLSHVKLLVMLRDGFIWPEGKGLSWMTDEQQRAVVQFVESGGAFLNLHNSMGLYPDNGPFLTLVGGRYIGHGPLERFRTEVVDPNHPITRGVSDFFTADEQHTPPYETNKVHLLLRNRSDDGKVAAAAGWVYEPGRGRLCHLANGHTREALNHPMFQRLMTNAVNWCLRREP